MNTEIIENFIIDDGVVSKVDETLSVFDTLPYAIALIEASFDDKENKAY